MENFENNNFNKQENYVKGDMNNAEGAGEDLGEDSNRINLIEKEKGYSLIKQGGFNNEKSGSHIPNKKRAIKFFLLLLLIVAISFVFVYFFVRYENYAGEKRIDNLARQLSDLEKRDYTRALADTYGGKTPQETLSLYIKAVEKGDYELASKYFIEGKREKELESLKNAKREGLNKYLDFLKEALNRKGSFSINKTGFVIRKPVIVDFKLYPNGIWKIIEI